MSDTAHKNNKQEIKHYASISKFVEEMNFTPTEHPMFYIQKITDANIKQKNNPDCSSDSSTSDSYIIFFKKLENAVINYGRTKYDFENGTLFFSKPGQVFSCRDEDAEPGGYFIMVHKDFFNGTPLAKTVKNYGFFDYAVNEALHLSPKEEQKIINLCENLDAEYQNNQDTFSKEIIISLLETLFKYSDRFYNRQFINRKDLNNDLFAKFSKALHSYSEQNLFETRGLPSISWIADELSITSRYLSDSLKVETGKSAKDLIQLFLIDEAKNLLLEPEASISETAYKLGFEYPQYFSRLFKQKEGISPKEYIEQHSAN